MHDPLTPEKAQFAPLPAEEPGGAAMRAWPPSRAQVPVVLAVAVAYFASARLGLLLAMPGGNVTPVWPPSGLALAAVILFGPRIWPGIWLGSFAANLWSFTHAADGMSSPAAIATAAGIGAGAALTAWLGARWIRRIAGTGSPIERIRDVCAFVGLGGAVACLLSASNGVLWLAAVGAAPSASESMWLTWWLGDAAGVFVFAPLLVAWFVPPSFPRPNRLAEACACFALLLAAGYLIFVMDPARWFSGERLTFLIIPFLVWPAVRLGQRGAATATLAVAFLAVWGAIRGSGPFVLSTRNESLLVLELFLSVVALSGLCVAAVASGQSRAEAERKIVLDGLESRILERTAALVAEIAERKRAEENLTDREAHLRAIVNTEPECVKLLAADGTLLDMNPAGLAMIEADSLAQVRGSQIGRLLAPESREPFATLTRRVFAGESGQLEFAMTGLKGGHRWLETHAVPLRGARGEIKALLGITHDITQRKQHEALSDGQKRVLEMIVSGDALPAILTTLLRVLEAQSPEMLCSILLLDPDGIHLRCSVAPSLPETFTHAFDGQPIGPCAGSCGTAAFRREPVIVEDIATDPLWAEYRAAALPHGLRACWSTPIFDARKNVLGTFAIYYRKPGRPTAQQRHLIEIATHTAAIAIARGRAEAALRESEEKFSRAFRNSPDAVVITTFDGEILEANAGFARLTGYAMEEILGRTTVELNFWKAAADRERFVSALREDGRVVELEEQFRIRTGEMRSCLISSELMELGGRSAIVDVVRDITERKRTEAALRESEERFRHLIDNAPDAIQLLDVTLGRFMQVNAQSERMFKLSTSELLRVGPVELSPPIQPDGRLSSEKAMQYVERAMAGETTVFEWTHRDAEGRDFPCEVRLLRMEIDGRPVVRGSIADITHRKSVEQALRERDERLRAAMAASGTGTFRWDLRTNELNCDEALDGLLGLSREQTIRSLENFAAAVHPDDRPELIGRREHSARDGTDFEMEYRILWPDGTVRWLDDRAKAFFDDAGKPLYMTGACVDITERKRSEAVLQDLVRRLLQAEDTERRRIAKELHDSTAQDLVAVMMNLGTLRDALSPLDAKPALILEDSIALVENSANDIRTLSYVLHPPRLDELGLPAGLTEYAAGLHKRTDIRIRVEAAPDFGRLPEELEVVLFRVAQESLVNVLRHSRSDAATIRLMRMNGSVVVEIEDYGCGIPEGDAVRAGAYGVGIAGMRERVQHLRGDLEVESDSHGTIVRAVMPLRKDAP